MSGDFRFGSGVKRKRGEGGVGLVIRTGRIDGGKNWEEKLCFVVLTRVCLQDGTAT